MLISITGPECSGKTTLTKYLSTALHVASVDEIARDYLNETVGHYTIKDLDVIAQRQLEAVRQVGGSMKRAEGAGPEKESLVITDTFLLVILIWSLHKYGRTSATIDALYDQNKPDFYLLCRPDLPWEHDRLRENQSEREVLFERYLEHIQHSDIPYFIVEGTGVERMRKALVEVQALIQKKLP